MDPYLIFDVFHYINEKVHDKYGKNTKVTLLNNVIIIEVVEPNRKLYRYYITINEKNIDEIEYQVSLYAEGQLESQYFTDYVNELYDIVDYFIDYQLGAPANVF